MSSSPPNVVYDCNVFVQALININGPGGACVRRALAKEVVLFLSEAVLAEIREAPTKPTPARLGVTVERTETLIENLLKVAVMTQVIPEQFTYSRDPDDAHYVNLALATESRLIVSRDKDLLSLMDQTRVEGRDFHARFPALRLLDPVEFLQELDRSRRRSSSEPE
jgi:putative PIN family toxin of toxin-antitoxin system